MTLEANVDNDVNMYAQFNVIVLHNIYERRELREFNAFAR